MDNSNTQNLAAKIAALLSQENEKGSDAELLRASLERINARLDNIEARLSNPNPPSEIRNPPVLHLSQEKFKSLEAIADEIIDQLQGVKPCPYEPTAKPCDNCSMCNSRGF